MIGEKRLVGGLDFCSWSVYSSVKGRKKDKELSCLKSPNKSTASYEFSCRIKTGVFTAITKHFIHPWFLILRTP